MSCRCIICYNAVKIILTRQTTYGFIWKMKQIIFDANIANNDVFKSFKHITKLLGDTEAQEISGIWRNTATAL